MSERKLRKAAQRMLTEKEIEQEIIEHIWLGEKSLCGTEAAAAAIAKRLSEGVMFADGFKAKGYDDHIRLTNGAGDAEFRTTDGGLDNDGQMYRVTVKIVEGTKDESS